VIWTDSELAFIDQAAIHLMAAQMGKPSPPDKKAAAALAYEHATALAEERKHRFPRKAAGFEGGPASVPTKRHV